MNYAEVAARVAIGLTTAAFAFATMLQSSPTMQQGVVMLLFVGAGLFLAAQALFVGIERSIHRGRQHPLESDLRSASADDDGTADG